MIDRVILIDKQPGPTSHDVVAQLRRALGERRVGHTGTLDPFASGLLVCCVGRATRLAAYISDFDKEYVGRVELGTETDSGDPTGRVVREMLVPDDWTAELALARNSLTGRVEQVPPMTSAVRVGGKRLYTLAHAGIEVERRPRTVQIHDLEVRPLGPRSFELRVRCSKGTYVRVLATDLAGRLGTCGTLAELRRVAVGGLRVERAFQSAELAEDRRDELLGAALAPVDALAGLPLVEIDDVSAARLRHGVAPTRDSVTRSEPPVGLGDRVRIVSQAGELLALGEACAPSLTGCVATDRDAGHRGPAFRLLRVVSGSEESRTP